MRLGPTPFSMEKENKLLSMGISLYYISNNI